jgi:hypothetical protein
MRLSIATQASTAGVARSKRGDSLDRSLDSERDSYLRRTKREPKQPRRSVTRLKKMDYHKA